MDPWLKLNRAAFLLLGERISGISRLAHRCTSPLKPAVWLSSLVLAPPVDFQAGGAVEIGAISKNGRDPFVYFCEAAWQPR